MNQHRRLDFAHVRRRRHRAIERNTRCQTRSQPDGKFVHNAAAETESDRAELAGAVRTRFQPVGRGDEIFKHFVAVHLLECGAAFLIVSGISANRRQAIGRERHIAFSAQTPRDIFNVGIQSAILVHHENGRPFSAGRGAHEIALDRPVSLRRRYSRVFGADALVVFRHLLGPGVIGLQHLEDGGGGQPADGELSRPVQKRATIDAAMDVLVKQIQQLLRKV